MPSFRPTKKRLSGDDRRSARVTAALNRHESEKLALVHKYVRGFCGDVPLSEAVRFLIRSWRSPWD